MSQTTAYSYGSGSGNSTGDTTILSGDVSHFAGIREVFNPSTGDTTIQLDIVPIGDINTITLSDYNDTTFTDGSPAWHVFPGAVGISSNAGEEDITFNWEV